jgi:hypothetical protein
VREETAVFNVPDQGLLPVCNGMISTVLNGAKCVLFTNNLTPSRSTVYADLVQPTFAGYSAALLTGWSAPSLSADGHYVTTASPVSWTKTDSGNQNVWGYGIVDALNNLLGAEQFPGAPTQIQQLVPFPLTASWQAKSEF